MKTSKIEKHGERDGGMACFFDDFSGQEVGNAVFYA